MNKAIATLASIVAVAGFSTAARALPAHLFENGSFETGNFSGDANDADELSVGSTDMTGWVVYNDDLSWIGPTNDFHNISASDGQYFLDLTGYHDNNIFGGVTQRFATTIGDEYRISFDLGDSTYYDPNTPAGIQLTVNSSSSESQTFISTNPGKSDGSYWQTESMNFTAGTSSTTIDLIGSQGQQFVGLDNVRVTDLGPAISAAPEPSSWALIIAGVGLIGAMLRIRPKSGFVRV